MRKYITGVQQIGIGVSNLNEAWKWYRQNFSMDIKVFEDESVAELMLPHTNGETKKRHAVLALNVQGGGGFEVWQHTERTPKAPDFEISIGDYGIFAAKLKTNDIGATYNFYKEKDINILCDITKDPSGNEHFFIKDPYGNIFQIVNEPVFFTQNKPFNGGAYGVIIGVSNIEKSLMVYKDILEYDEIVYDKEGHFKDLEILPGGKNKFRRVLLKHSKPRQGGFSKMLGPSQIELVKLIDGNPRNIYENRIWGDLGFIHLCFDIVGMDYLRDECKEKGYPFTVDSAESFDMGEAAGHFSYIQDPDGTLIEFVETHRIPIIKKIGWYLNLKKRNPLKPLPDFMLKSLRFNRVKDK
ncbi:MAG: VOC family protein [Bacteroidales bacterium]|nr:VOC family protein [Bacteroidales bacterium]